MSVMLVVFANSPHETTEVQRMFVTGLVVITGGFAKGVDCLSEFFLQPAASHNTQVKIAIIKKFINFMDKYLKIS